MPRVFKYSKFNLKIFIPNADQISDLVVSIYTDDYNLATELIGRYTIEGNIVSIVVPETAVSNMNDGIINYIATGTINGNPYTIQRQSNYYLKTTATYSGGDVVPISIIFEDEGDDTMTIEADNFGVTGFDVVTINAADYGEEKYNEGTNIGYESGRTEGYEQGYESGYTDGYVQGDASSKINVAELGLKFGYSNVEEFGNKYNFEGVSDYKNMFYQSSAVNIDSINTSLGVDLEYMCYNCTNLTSINTIDCTNATDISSIFYGCGNLREVEFSNMNKVQYTTEAFKNCGSIQTINGLNTSTALGMNSTFNNCTALKYISPIDISNAQSVNYLFYNCQSLSSITLTDTSAITKSLYYAFCECRSLKNIYGLENVKPTNLAYCFENCFALETAPEMDTSNVRDFRSAFLYATSLTTVPKYDVSKDVNGLHSTFIGCGKLTNLGGFTGLKGAIDLSYSDLITRESMLNIFNEAATITNTYSIGISQTVYDRLTEDDIAIAVGKGWNVSIL